MLVKNAFVSDAGRHNIRQQQEQIRSWEDALLLQGKNRRHFRCGQPARHWLGNGEGYSPLKARGLRFSTST